MRNYSYLLSLVFVFAIPWENIIAVGGVSVLTKLIGIIMAIIWFVSTLKDGFRKPHIFHILTLFYIIWNITTFFWSVDIEYTALNIKTYLQIGIMAWIFWDLYTTPKNLLAGLQSYVLGAYISIINIIINYFMGLESHLRYSVTGYNPNDLGLILALGIPVAWYLFISKDTDNGLKVLRLLNFAYVPLATLAILLTGSRGSLVATLPCLFFFTVSIARMKLYQKIIIFSVLASSLIALLQFVPDNSFKRISDTTATIADADLHGRVNIWKNGIRIISEHPVLGIGSGAFRIVSESGKVAHNAFISVLVETGIVGFILFAGILAIIFYEAIHQPKNYSILWITIFFVWFLGANVHTLEQEKITWFFLNLTVISASIYNKRTALKKFSSL